MARAPISAPGAATTLPFSTAFRSCSSIASPAIAATNACTSPPVAEAPGDLLLALERAAHRQHRHVGEEGEGGEKPRDVAVVVRELRRAALGHGRERGVREAIDQGAHAVADHVADVRGKGIVEL